MTTPTLQRLLTGILAAVTLTACTTITGANVDTKTEADATTAVQQYADQVADVAGSSLIDPATTASPCTGTGTGTGTGKLGEADRDVFTMQGAYQIALPVEKHIDTISRLRDMWKANGYSITDDRTVGGNRGVIAAKTGDGFSFTVQSTTPPTMVAVLVHSPCYKSPTPR
jgi:hypothetical protein